MVEAEDHHLQIDADLRRGQAGAVDRSHGVEQVDDERLQVSRAEGLHRLRQERVRAAHL